MKKRRVIALKIVNLYARHTVCLKGYLAYNKYLLLLINNMIEELLPTYTGNSSYLTKHNLSESL